MKHLFFYTALLLTTNSLLLQACHNKNASQASKGNFTQNIFPSKSDTVLMVSMSFYETDLLPIIGAKMSSFYHLPVKYKSAPLPSFAYYAPRNRFRADSLIKYLKQLNAGQYHFVAGLTSKDISCTMAKYPDWGVFGLGSLDASGCITSTFRLRNGVSRQKLIERLEKVVLHEIGHNQGLNHCTTPYACFMKAANGKVSEVDGEPMDICTSCRSKIKLNNK